LGRKGARLSPAASRQKAAAEKGRRSGWRSWILWEVRIRA